MKPKWLTLAWFGSCASLLALVNSVNARETQETKFVCGAWRDTPMTVAQTPRGDVPVIYWVSDWVNDSDSDLSPQNRCEIVSENFQQAYDRGELRYLTVGKKNNADIVCVAEYDGGPCQSQLFTLKPGSDPEDSLLQLMNINRSASPSPLEQSTGKQRLYIDLENFINKAAKIEN